MRELVLLWGSLGGKAAAAEKRLRAHGLDTSERSPPVPGPGDTSGCRSLHHDLNCSCFRTSGVVPGA